MSTVDDVKARLDIVDVIGSYVPLQKAGRAFKAPCPFHNEKTPSFIVNPDRQTWHCFGACGTGGDIFAFVAKKENLDFGGALRLLAERAGVELQSEGPRRQELKTLYDLNEAACFYFQSLLVGSARPGTPAAVVRAYAESRGLDAEIIRDFSLGFSLPGWDGLRNHLAGRGFAEAMLIESGLTIASDRGSYDRFRGRLMVPIRDERGRICGFGGRTVPGLDEAESNAKYINTPSTPIFDKGSILYALDRSKEEMRLEGKAVIVEGYMDVIAAHQHGFKNVVASMGTSLTERQAILVQRFASTVVLAMDADAAGNAAALRGIQVVAAAAEVTQRSRTPAATSGARTLDIRVAALPDGVDPDELVRRRPADWANLINESRPVVDHLLTVIAAGLDLEDGHQRATLVAEVLPAIAEVANPVLRAGYITQLSQKARMGRAGEETLNRQVAGLRRQRARPEPDKPRGTGPSMSEKPAAVAAVARAPREEFCLALLFQKPELRPVAAGLDEELFTLSENRELLRRWRAQDEVEEEDGALWEHYQRIVSAPLPVYETNVSEAALLDCMARLDQSRMKEVKEASALALAEGEAGVRPGQVASIALARLEAGNTGETPADDPESQVASRLLEDMEAGLRFHRRLIEGDPPDLRGNSFLREGW